MNSKEILNSSEAATDPQGRLEALVRPGAVGCKIMLDLSPEAISKRAEQHDFAPWHELSAVFIGGSDAFKKAPEARAAATAARMLGKWVRVGRVNTAARAIEWLDLADSFDGSGISRDPRDDQLASVLAVIKGDSRQPTLFGDA